MLQESWLHRRLLDERVQAGVVEVSRDDVEFLVCHVHLGELVLVQIMLEVAFAEPLQTLHHPDLNLVQVRGRLDLAFLLHLLLVLFELFFVSQHFHVP